MRGVTWEGWQLCQISDTCEIVLRNNLLVLTKKWLLHNTVHTEELKLELELEELAGYYILTCRHTFSEYFAIKFIQYSTVYNTIITVFYGVL